MSKPAVLLFVVIVAQTYMCSIVSEQNYKQFDKRLINGSPINSTYFDKSWYFTATIEIWHKSGDEWLSHNSCLGSFLNANGTFMIVTAADCFFPPLYVHTEFSYLSKNNYRVFLGFLRIRYGSISTTSSNKFALRSTVLHPLVIIHPEWKFGNSTESTNIAAIIITSKCIKVLDVALAKNQISKVPVFLQSIDEFKGPVKGYCRLAGWKIKWSEDFDALNYRKNLKVEFLLDFGWFFSQNSSACNQHFSLLNMPKQVEDSTFCLSGFYNECVDLYLTSYEHGSGVVCSGNWSGFVSAIVSKGPVVRGIPQMQFGTVSSAAMIRNFVYEVNFTSNSVATCRISHLDPSSVGSGDTKGFSVNSPKDYAGP